MAKAPAPITNLDKAATLLARLDPKALDKVFEMLGPEFAGKLRPIVSAVTKRKDFTALTEQVLQEFRELQQDVQAAVVGAPVLQQQLQSSSHPGSQSVSNENPTSGTTPEAAASAPTTPAPQAQQDPNMLPPPAEDPEDAAICAEVTSLKKVPPAVLGAALKAETPRMIATVLKQLPAELSGKVLELLPAEQRQNVFLMMADKIQISSAIVGRVLQRVLDVCRTVNPAAVARTDRRVTTLIGILQTVEREEKIRLMETLAERDPELAAKVDDLMYDYTDVLRIEDRSVQKLLGQLEQKIVAMALKTAPDDLREKIMKNLSERVRLALTEEMELLSGVTPSKADQARREIATVIRNQDKEGAIMWMEG
jgi:flagellar motor switch protein FliG